MTNKKMMLVPAALILALFASAFTYGLWFQTLTVDGTVETGDLEWIVWAQFTSDEGIAPDRSILPGFSGPPFTVPEGKNVGNTWCEIARDGKSVTFYLNNTYPCYLAMCSVYFQNIGTIPLHIECVEFLDAQDNLIYNFTYPTYDMPPLNLSLDDDCMPDIEVWLLENLGEQVHPGQVSNEYSFWIHVLQTASEDSCYTFKMKFTAVQWNESEWPVPQALVGAPT